MKYVGTILIILMVIVASIITWIMMEIIPKTNKITVEVIYFDNSKEIITTTNHFGNRVQILGNSCTVNIYDYPRCNVKAVNILKIEE